MRKCKCGNQVARNAKACPQCGHRFTSGTVKFLGWFIVIVFALGGLGAMIGGSDSQSSANTPPAATAPAAAPTVPPTPQQVAKIKIAARQDYAKELEKSLLSKGLDAHVTVVGQGIDTLRISWAAMSRPVVYNMINSEGTQKEIPSLGFKKIIFTDDGSFSEDSPESWTYKWDGQQWHQ
jgi:hypothetical protein